MSFYVQLKNGQIDNYINYLPELPEGFSVVEITDTEFDQIVNQQTHYFDTADNTVKIIVKTNDDKWFDIRNKRNTLLRESDWTVMPDSPLNSDKKTEWTNYRNTLRNIPQTYNNPDDVVWPNEPQ
tara:strand:- start:3511 stop:3885 length:375 start_codon:yes stop_codon:yes gene_type:complete